MRSDLPTGTVTFLFTDVEGSTKLLHELGAERYAEALALHRRLIREACATQGGVEVDTQGDAFFFAFASAPGALAAASSFTDALESGPIRVRVGLHTGTPHLAEEGYVGGDVHRAARIAAAGHGGQVLVSASTAPLAELELRDLGEHRFKDLAAPERVYQLGAGDFPPLKSLYRTNLPVPVTPFLGRERELAELIELLSNGIRLLTLTGPGGTGKTRLALQAAAEVADGFPDGVFWVPLAALRDPELVLETATQVVGSTNGLADHLRDKRLLLLLDNFEQVVEAALQLTALLAACPSLTLLVTSRETLRLQAEVEYPVPPLASEEGVELFCARARVEPTDAVGELCRRLDNLPLAIELAAARAKLLSPDQLLERLSARLDLLKGGRDADPRQQTLRATIEWSYNLLNEEEKLLLARLSVFAGGCTLEAAEDVCSADPDTLESLLDKSLLRRRGEERVPRYWMLETIREYASEKLTESSEPEQLRAGHAQYFLDLAEKLEPPLMGGVDEEWAMRLRAETDNLRAAIELFSDQPEPSGELRLVGSLFRFWPTVGLVAEGRRLADHALQRSGEHRRLRLKLLFAASVCAFYQAEYEDARRYEDERLEIARTLGDKQAEIVALNDLGLIALETGDVERADALFAEGTRIAELLDDEHLLMSLTNNRGDLAIDRGDFAEAEELLEEALAIAYRLRDPWSIAHCLESLGRALLAQSEWTLAAERLREGVGLVGVVPLVASDCLDGLAAVAVARGDPARASRLTGAADTMREGGFRTWGTWRALADETERTARAALGDDAWEAERAVGGAMSLEEAVAYALEACGA